LIMFFELQRFAEGEGTGEVQGDNAASNGDKTSADVGEIKQDNPADDVQAKIDAAVSAQLAKAQARWEQEFKKREELAKKEAERLSKLSDDERAKAELENTRKELEKQKADFERQKLSYETAKVLSQRNLPVDFVDYLIGDDSESTLDNIKTFEKKFNKAVEDMVTLKLKGKAPQTGGKTIDNSGGTDAFMKAILDSQVRYR